MNLVEKAKLMALMARQSSDEEAKKYAQAFFDVCKQATHAEAMEILDIAFVG